MNTENSINIEPDGSRYSAKTGIATHPSDKNIALVQFGDTSLVKTVNGGDTWTYSGNGYMGGRIGKQTAYYFDKNGNKWVYFMVDHGVLMTENNGDTWRRIVTGELRVDDFRGNTTIVGAVDPNNPDTMIVFVGSWVSPGAYQIKRTTNGGKDWIKVKETMEVSCSFLAFHPLDSDYVYAGTDDGNGWMSSDNGENWVEIPGKSIRAVSPKDGVIYAFEYPSSGGSSILYRSIDKGENWDNLGVTLFNRPVAVAIDPQNSNNLYVSSSNYLYVFNGTIWKNIAIEGIPLEKFGDRDWRVLSVLAVDPLRPNIIYAGLKAPGAGHRITLVNIQRFTD